MAGDRWSREGSERQGGILIEIDDNEERCPFGLSRDRTSRRRSYSRFCPLAFLSIAMKLVDDDERKARHILYMLSHMLRLDIALTFPSTTELLRTRKQARVIIAMGYDGEKEEVKSYSRQEEAVFAENPEASTFPMRGITSELASQETTPH